MRKSILIVLIFVIFCFSCGQREQISMDRNKDTDFIKSKLAKFTEVELTVDRSTLTDNQFEVIKHLVKAAEAVDEIFWNQSYRHSLAMKNELEKSNDSIDQDYLHFLNINYGPFDRQDNENPFIGKKEKPKGAGFYPEDLTKEELEAFIEQNPEKKEEFYKLNTLVKRNNGELVAVPFEEEYRVQLQKAGDHLKNAAEICEDELFKKYLSLRAEDILSGDFFNSDMAWMDLQNNALDIVIGPIETYEDQLMGLKSSYQGKVMIQDKKETKKLDQYKKNMNQLEQNLPVPRLYKKAKAAPSAPIGVFNTIYASGDGNVAVKSIAFSLPNDEKVRELKGARTVQEKNIILAKFEKILVPISKRVLTDELLDYVDGDAFFTNTLLHELAHPLGLNYVKDKNGLTVRKSLKETYSTIEEAKADVVGLYNIGYFVRKRILDSEFEVKSYITFLASIFRSVRFGASEAHGQANMITFNYLMKENAIILDENSGRYGINLKIMKNAIKKLASDLLMIEGDGNYKKASKWVKELAIIPPQMQTLLDNLKDIPIDLEYKFDPTLFE